MAFILKHNPLVHLEMFYTAVIQVVAYNGIEGKKRSKEQTGTFILNVPAKPRDT